MRRNTVPKEVHDSRQLIKRRMPREERMETMLDQAAAVLADEGFAVSTRRLATALNTAHPLGVGR